uniref:Uncharacterized protein n=1 Tax=Arabidopsis thaliana TaxID=3702 RepID=Q56YI7_ARATH|nr:hypothetical protein [Arabidopsis thaliana]
MYGLGFCEGRGAGGDCKNGDVDVEDEGETVSEFEGRDKVPQARASD